MSILEVKNLKKSFGDNEVLKGVSFSLEKGEVLSIIGSSGGGKTTLLRCLNFLEKPDSGEITVGNEKVFFVDEDGKGIVSEGAQKRLGLVFQQFYLFPQYSVKQNLTLAPRLLVKSRDPKGYRANKKEINQRIEKEADDILAMTGLSDKADTYPCFLSGGQQQRVAIARALMLSPDILCFDEPTSSLDPELTGEVLKVIKELKSSDRTMIVVTHELEFARAVSDKIMFVCEGKIEEFGDPESVFERPLSAKTSAFINGSGKF